MATYVRAELVDERRLNTTSRLAPDTLKAGIIPIPNIIIGFPEETYETIRATTHRVLGHGRERYSIPFFFEASVDAVIAPLPLPGAQPFAPFYFGDHLWEVTTRFVEQRGIAHLRTPRAHRLPAAPN